jgi:hypothetical protein
MKRNLYAELTPEQQEATRWGASLVLVKALAKNDAAALANRGNYYDSLIEKIAGDDRAISFLFRRYHDPEKRLKMETDYAQGVDVLSLLGFERNASGRGR